MDPRPLSPDSITRAFLNHPNLQEQSADDQLYLLDKLLPSVVPALEHLMQYVERNKDRERAPTQLGTIDPLNYVAQYLFRNNSSAALPDSSQSAGKDSIYDREYRFSMAKTAKEWRAKIARIQREQEKLELQRLEQERRAASAAARKIASAVPRASTSSADQLNSAGEESENEDPTSLKASRSRRSKKNHHSAVSESPALAALRQTSSGRSSPAVSQENLGSRNAGLSQSTQDLARARRVQILDSVFARMAGVSSLSNGPTAANSSSEPLELPLRRFHNLLDFCAASLTLQEDSQAEKWKACLQLLRFQVPPKLLLTRTVSVHEFREHGLAQSASANLQDAEFERLFALLEQTAEKENQDRGQGYRMSTAEYAQVEAEIVRDLDVKSKRLDVDSKQLLRDVVTKLSVGLQLEHPILNVYVSLLETVGEQTTILRYAAATPKDESLLMGQYLTKEEARTSFEAVHTKQPVVVSNIRESSFRVKVFGDRPEDAATMNRNGSFMAIPIVVNGIAIGVLGTDSLAATSGKVRPFDSRDMQLFSKIAAKLGAAYTLAEQKKNTLELSLSAAHWMKELMDADAEIYFVDHAKPDEFQLWTYPIEEATKNAAAPRTESPEGAAEAEREEEDDREEEAEDDSTTVDGTTDAASSVGDLLGSHGNTFDVANLKPVDLAHPEKQFLNDCITTKQPVQNKNSSQHAFPIHDKTGQVLAVLVQKRPTPSSDVKGKETAISAESVERVLSILEKGLDSLSTHGVNAVLEKEDAKGEGMEGLFARFLLHHVNEQLAQIDNATLAEIRSYRSPPKVVRLILKAVLYVFGAKPKELAQWTNIVKHVNLDLLQKMIHYDPTAVQKKLYFKRVKGILKNVPAYQNRRQVSLAADNMFQWLLVSLAIRARAVSARKKQKELESNVKERQAQVVLEIPHVRRPMKSAGSSRASSRISMLKEEEH